MRDTRGTVEMELLRKSKQRTARQGAKGAVLSSSWPDSCCGSGQVELEEMDAPTCYNEVEDGLAVRSLDDFYVCDAETGEPFQLEQLDDLKAATEKDGGKEKGESGEGEGKAEDGAATAAAASSSSPSSTTVDTTTKVKKKRRIMAFGTLVLPTPMGLRVSRLLRTSLGRRD